MDKKGQSKGIITGLVFGVASLVIAVIIAFVIVSTLTNADLLTSSRTTTTTTNETGAYINATGYTLANYDAATTTAISISQAWNYTDGTLIPSSKYTLSSSGVLTNATTTTYANVSVTYSVTTKSSEEQGTEKLSGNFTSGVNNISSKIPTVLLIAAIILILGVLAILVGVWQKMRMGGGSQL